MRSFTTLLVVLVAAASTVSGEFHAGVSELGRLEKYLLEAAGEGETKTLLKLLKAGADPKAKTEFGETALHLAGICMVR